MKKAWALLLCTLIAIQLLPVVLAGPYIEEEGVQEGIEPEDYSENAIEQLLQNAQKRACIRRGGNCDHRPNDCCYNFSSCRCNLWGTNCRCQRMGLFQKWG